MADAPKILGTDTLRNAYPKLNSAIDNANEALSTANTANSKSDDAVATANDANTKSDSTQTQLDAVVNRATDTDAMSRQAAVDTSGVDKVNLKQRLDDDYNEVTTQLAENTTQQQNRGYDIRWNALLALNGDWTQAIQTALDNNKHVYIPNGTFPFTSLNVTKENAKITGNSQLYSESILQYNGTGTAITVASTVGYLSLEKMFIQGIPNISTDYFNSGTVGIDVTAGATSLVADKVRISGFETLVKSNFNSYYNKFLYCRFDHALNCLLNFADYNFEVRGSRFQNYNTAITANGTAGTMTINKNTFEVFNGAIIARTGAEEGVVNFSDNYVEIYDTVDLPTNFPNQTANGATAGKFGGNTLFTGPYKILNIEENTMLINSVFRVVNASSCRQFTSKNNLYSIYATGNNLDKLFSIPNVETYYINDRSSMNGEGTYSRTYSQAAIALPNPYNDSYFYDCILGKELVSNDRVYSPNLQNGWAQGNASYGFPRIFVAKDGLHLQGYLNGTNKTGTIVFNIPSKYRPFEINTNKGYANITCFTAAGAFVRFRYVYSTGDFNLDNTPTDLVDINLDGCVIPVRI